MMSVAGNRDPALTRYGTPMPNTTPERRARWGATAGEAEGNATCFLVAQGYKLRKDWSWDPPSPTHQPTEREIDAVVYMVEDWDYGGIAR